MKTYKEQIKQKIEKKFPTRAKKLVPALNKLHNNKDIKIWVVRNNLNLNQQQTLPKKQITLQKQITQPKKKTTQSEKQTTQPKKQTTQPKKQITQPKKKTTQQKKQTTQQKKQTTQPKKQIIIKQIPKELKTLKYYDSSYNVKCTLENKNVVLNLSGKNARVVLNIERETKDDYIDYPNVPDNFYSDIRIFFLYRQEKPEEAPAPKNYTRRMLCYGLLYCIEQGFVNKNSIITVKAEHSENDELLKKIYIPLGFRVITVDTDDDTTLMKSTVGRLLSWCDTQYNKQSNKKQQSFYNKIINFFAPTKQSEIDVDKQILKLYTSRKELQIRKEQFEQLLKNLNNTKYYDSSYKIKFTRNKKRMNDNSAKDVLIIEGKNAEVMLYINDLKKEDYENYTNISRNFSSNIHLASLYRQTDEDLPPAPKNYTRRMLCYALLYCIKQKYIRKEYTYITLEAEYSENDELIKKVYMPMGFEVVGKDKYNEMTLMRSTIEKLLYWCDKKY